MESYQNIRPEGSDALKQLAIILLQQIDKQEPKGFSLGEMASATNMTRKAIHDLLLSLQADGILEICRNRIIIKMKALEQALI